MIAVAVMVLLTLAIVILSSTDIARGNGSGTRRASPPERATEAPDGSMATTA